METQDAKQRLLDATVDYVAEHGLADLSLRGLAAAIGTSHRMLIYHFGSKEGLLVAVVRAVEQQQRDAMHALELDGSLSESEMMRHIWKRVSDPKLWPNARLFYELYGQALAGREGVEAFLDDIVESWVAPVSMDLARRHGLSRADARADARLRIAVVRGLLLDLLATGDRKSVDRAHEMFVTMCESVASR